MSTEGQQGVSPAAGAPAGVRSIAPYRPGRPIGEVARELGLDPAGIVKLASNENPLGMSPKAVAAAQQVLAGGARYPDANGHDLKQALARHYGVTPVFSGFSAEIAFVTKADNNDKAKYDFNLMYDNGPLAAAIAYNKIKDSKTNYALGAKYNFGMFALSAGYYDTRDQIFPALPAGSKTRIPGKISSATNGGKS